MGIEVPEEVPHARPEAFEWLLALAGVHGVLAEIVEEYAPDDNEADQRPLHYLRPLVPHGLDGLRLDAALELPLKAELLLLGEGAEIRRPDLFRGEAIAREVEGREGVLVPAEQAVDELEHGVWMERETRGSNRL